MNNQELSRVALVCGWIFVAMILVSTDFASYLAFGFSMLCWGLSLGFGLAKEEKAKA